MCRLFGFRSNTPEFVHRSLLSEKNSLRRQSQEHKDGWGIAYYADGETPQVAHGLGPAHADPEFERVSNLLSSRAVVAHVRLASVGEVALRNAHPFLHGPWAFAHNGTVQRFAEHRARIESLIEPRFLPLLRGETDSERCFFLFLSKLDAIRRGQTPVVQVVAAALALTMRDLAFTDTAEKPSSMNFLVTDGKLMVASRRQRTLFYSEVPGTTGPRSEPPPTGERVTQVVIASEELSGESHWHEVPDESLIAVDPELCLHHWAATELVARFG